ncbi:hypothetical protein HK096_001375, partial [Nowakowskiella sp. JEL0078]
MCSSFNVDASEYKVLVRPKLEVRETDLDAVFGEDSENLDKLFISWRSIEDWLTGDELYNFC